MSGLIGGKNIHKTKIKNEILFLAKDLCFRFNFDSFLYSFGTQNFGFQFRFLFYDLLDLRFL